MKDSLKSFTKTFILLILSITIFLPLRANAQSVQCLNLQKDGSCTSGEYTIRYTGVDEFGNRHFNVRKVSLGTDERYIDSPFLTDYLAAMYKYAVIATTILVTVVIIFAGVLYITSAGNTEQTGRAKKMIGRAITGLVLAVGSYTILWTINPQLVEFGGLKILRIEKMDISEALQNARLRDETVASNKPSGIGDPLSAKKTDCMALQAGSKTTAAFTTYWDVSAKSFGNNAGYEGVYQGQGTPAEKTMGDFYCKISMECGCPDNYKADRSTTPTCGTKNAYFPCKPFSKDISYCPTSGKKACESIAASTCFPKGTKIKVGDKVLTVADRGAAIMGTHFDLYLGVEGDESNWCNDTKWLKTDIEILSIETKTISAKEISNMRSAYRNYIKRRGLGIQFNQEGKNFR